MIQVIKGTDIQINVKFTISNADIQGIELWYYTNANNMISIPQDNIVPNLDGNGYKVALTSEDTQDFKGLVKCKYHIKLNNDIFPDGIQDIIGDSNLNLNFI